MQTPLSGIRVLDLSRALAGPLCSSLLADLGAEVVKLEGGPHGDPARAWGPFDDGESLYFAAVNRNKTSVAIDYRAPGAIALIEEMIAQVDVLIENFRPGVMSSMGLDPDELRRRHPSLVISSVSGYGSVGPERETPGLDQVAQGMSGLMSVTGPDAAHMSRVGVPIVDELAGMFSAIGIVAALVGRARTDEGSRVETSLLESGIAAMTFHAQTYLSSGAVPAPQGNHHAVIAPYGAFAAADMSISIAVGTQRQWVQFCDILGAPELVERAEYASGELRSRNVAALAIDIEERLRTRPGAYWLEQCKAAGIPSGPIYTLDQTFADPQVQALDLVAHVENDRGRVVPVVRGPLSLDGVPTPVVRPAPILGAHAREVLARFGLAAERIDGLIEAGVVVDPSGRR